MNSDKPVPKNGKEQWTIINKVAMLGVIFLCIMLISIAMGQILEHSKEFLQRATSIIALIATAGTCASFIAMNIVEYKTQQNKEQK